MLGAMFSIKADFGEMRFFCRELAIISRENLICHPNLSRKGFSSILLNLISLFRFFRERKRFYLLKR